MIDWETIILSLKLATTTTFLLLIVSIPFAWWLSRSTGWFSRIAETLSTLPLVLPPTVLGFYLLLLLGKDGPIGQLANKLGLEPLVFSFSGLVIGSMIYSLPFAVQPLVASFKSIDKHLLEAAASLRASPLDQFISIALPLAKPGLLSAAILTFAHTLGEFGVILMIGGNIPGETRVLSTAIYDHVEALEYTQAHWLSGIMLLGSFIILLSLQALRHKSKAKRLESGISHS